MIWDAHKFVASLNPSERISLLNALQAPLAPQTENLAFPDLRAAEAWFFDRAMHAPAPYLNARWRMWFIFMFLRYGALKLGEIFRLTANDPDFENCVINIIGKSTGRKVFLPPPIAHNLRQAWNKWPGHLGQFYPLACDASLVRRTLGLCAAACQLKPARLNASALRHHRASELIAQGAHPAVAAYFLGSSNSPAPFSPVQAQLLLENLIKGPPTPKSSARNIFRCQIEQIVTRGILVELRLLTTSGLQLHAAITSTSCRNLQLRSGGIVNAMVKAPWLEIHPLASKIRADNSFGGKIEAIHKDPLAWEVLINLPQGDELCALLLNPAPDTSFKVNDEILICFSSLSVIVTTG